MEKTLPLPSQMNSENEIHTLIEFTGLFFEDLKKSFDDVMEASVSLLNEHNDSLNNRLLETLSSTNIDNNSEISKPAPEQETTRITSSQTKDTEPEKDKVKDFLYDMSFAMFGASGLGKKLKDNKERVEVNKTNETSVPALTQEEKNEDAVIQKKLVTTEEEVMKQQKETNSLLGQLLGVSEKSQENSGGSGGLLSGMLMGGLLGGILEKIKTGIMTAFKLLFNPKTIFKALSKVFAPIAIIATLTAGIMDGFKEFQESGSIVEALKAGLGGMLEFITFGLFDKESLDGMFDWLGEAYDTYIKDPIQNYIIDPIKNMFEKVSGWFTDISDSIFEFFDNFKIPGISFSVMGKEIGIGPWYPFKKDGETKSADNTEIDTTEDKKEDKEGSKTLETIGKALSYTPIGLAARAGEALYSSIFGDNAETEVISEGSKDTKKQSTKKLSLGKQMKSSHEISEPTSFEEVPPGGEKYYNVLQTDPTQKLQMLVSHKQIAQSEDLDIKVLDTSKTDQQDKIISLTENSKDNLNAKTLGKEVSDKVKIVIPPAPSQAAPSQDKKTEIINSPFSKRIESGENSFSKYMTSAYDF